MKRKGEKLNDIGKIAAFPQRNIKQKERTAMQFSLLNLSILTDSSWVLRPFILMDSSWELRPKFLSLSLFARELFFDTSFLTCELAEVIELSATYLTYLVQLD